MVFERSWKGFGEVLDRLRGGFGEGFVEVWERSSEVLRGFGKVLERSWSSF